jgi:hypothetical protein
MALRRTEELIYYMRLGVGRGNEYKNGFEQISPAIKIPVRTGLNGGVSILLRHPVLELRLRSLQFCKYGKQFH